MLWKFQILSKSFKNTLRCKLYEIIGKSVYPSSILPKTNFKGSIDFDLLLASNNNIFLVRRSDKSLAETFQILDGAYILRSNSILPDRIPKLSLNLLGGFFNLEHLRFSISHRAPGGQKWSENESIKLRNYLNDFTIVDVGCGIFLHANKIDGSTFPYSYPYDKTTSKIVHEFESRIGQGAIKIIDPKDGKSKFCEVSGQVKLKHDPLKLNYWHIEMLTLAFNEDEVPKKSAKWHEVYFNSVMTHVIKANAYASPENFGLVDSSFYRN